MNNPIKDTRIYLRHGELVEHLQDLRGIGESQSFEARTFRRKTAQTISDELGRQVISRYQVRELAYLLGLNDPNPNIVMPSVNTFKRFILKHIPNEDIFDCLGLRCFLQFPKFKGYFGTHAYSTDGVRIGLERVGSIGLLDYSYERFMEGLAII